MRDLKWKRWIQLASVFFYLTVPCTLFMFYWSSLEKESQLIHLRRQVQQLETKLNTLANNWQFQSLHQNQLKSHPDIQPSDVLASDAVASDQPALALLKPDPFYERTLPKLLSQGFNIGGKRVQPFLTKPENFHPLSNLAEISQLWDLCIRSMGRTHVGFYDRLAPSLASQIEIRPRKELPQGNLEKTGEFWVFLRKDLVWDEVNPSLFPEGFKLSEHFFERKPVTAWDVKFYYDAVMNPHVQIPGAIAQREQYQDIELFEVVDDYTFKVRWKLKEIPGTDEQAMAYVSKFLVAGLRPLPRFVFQYYPDGTRIVEDDAHPDTYKTHSVWAQVFIDHWAQHAIIGCGDWFLADKTAGEMLFRRNTLAPDPYGALNEELDFRIRESSDGVWQDFKENRIDSCYIRPSQLPEKERFLNSAEYKEQLSNKGNEIQQLSYVSRSFAFIGWNLKNPLFEEAKVRRALTLAIDREGIIRQILDNEAVTTTGPFHVASPSYDKSIQPYPYDPIRAAQLLDELGWIDHDGDGIRDKLIDGKSLPFSFHLTYFVKNPTGKLICETVAEQLKKVGIQCLLTGVDAADLVRAMDEKSFEGLLMAWLLGTPPEVLRQLWHSTSALNLGSSNCIGYQNKRADQIIEELDYTYDPTKREKLYHEMHRMLHEEQPYTFLYSGVNNLVYRNRLQNVFLPIERQDLIPGAQTSEPQSRLLFVKSDAAPSALQKTQVQETVFQETEVDL